MKAITPEFLAELRNKHDMSFQHEVRHIAREEIQLDKGNPTSAADFDQRVRLIIRQELLAQQRPGGLLR